MIVIDEDRMNLQIFDEAVNRQRARRRLPDPNTCRLLRRQLGISIITVAETLGVRKETVSRWELGHRQPRGKNAVRYLELLERMQAELLKEASA